MLLCGPRMRPVRRASSVVRTGSVVCGCLESKARRSNESVMLFLFSRYWRVFSVRELNPLLHPHHSLSSAQNRPSSPSPSFPSPSSHSPPTHPQLSRTHPPSQPPPPAYQPAVHPHPHPQPTPSHAPPSSAPRLPEPNAPDPRKKPCYTASRGLRFPAHGPRICICICICIALHDIAV